MKIYAIFAILLVTTNALSKSDIALREDNEPAAPMTPNAAMDILKKLTDMVKIEVKLDANTLFDQIRDLMGRPGKDPYAVLINGTGQTTQFEGCPSTAIGRIMGCNPHTTSAGKPNFITKPHGMLSNNQILCRVGGKDVQILQEGFFYQYVDGGFEAKGTIDDWRNATGLNGPTFAATFPGTSLVLKKVKPVKRHLYKTALKVDQKNLKSYVMTKDMAMVLLNSLKKRVSAGFTLDANILFDQIKHMMANPPKQSYAVVINGQNNLMSFDACPETFFARLMNNCNEFLTERGTANWLIRPHNLFGNDKILCEASEMISFDFLGKQEWDKKFKSRRMLQEGNFYMWVDNDFEQIGTIENWKNATK